MNFRVWISSVLLLATIVAAAGGLAAWKHAALQEANATAANLPEPMEAVTVAMAMQRQHRPTTTSVGTIIALRSITLRNELPGTVQQAMLTPGQIVDAGTVLVKLDTSVEEAELKAQQAQAALAQTLLDRVQRLSHTRAVSPEAVDRARAERDVALAQIARSEAIIARKTIRAPFRARVGMADVHPGQYLSEGTELAKLQGVDAAVQVDFAVPQQVAAGLRAGDGVEVFVGGETAPVAAAIVAVDARVDPATRNALVRARIEDGARVAAPGASVRVRVSLGPPLKVVSIPVSALRKGPGGDHVFVIGQTGDGQARASLRQVESGAILGDEVLIHAGLAAGEPVAATGSFKLREGVLVAVANGKTQAASVTR